ncbi:hypothetical protein TNCV_4459221 [Trichonephila clavipes]|nr:hypothetical protein TNCV_4459221 [Trichonephila clavipes]
MRVRHQPSGEGIGSSYACNEFETSTTKDPPCREAMHVKSVERSNVLQLVWCGRLLLGWFVAGFLHSRFRVRPRPKLVDFHDAEIRQRPCRMIIQHVKDPQNVCLAWMLSAKLNPGRGSHPQSSCASLYGGLGVKITGGDWCPPIGRLTKK